MDRRKDEDESRPQVCHVVSGTDRAGRRSAMDAFEVSIRPVRSAHERKITLHSGTMLASNASNHVAVLHLAAIPTSRAVSTKAMKISPWTIPKTFTPISVRGLPRYLKYIPASRPTQLTASARATTRNRPAAVRTSKALVMGAIVPESPTNYYKAS